MSISSVQSRRIKKLLAEYRRLAVGKTRLLKVLDEVELPEGVYNSNAIENSTLTLKETEKILHEEEVERQVSVREVFETKNLANVSEYISDNISTLELNNGLILLLHKMLMAGIDDEIAGRFRKKGEFVRVGSHIGLPPEHIETAVSSALNELQESEVNIESLAKFHLEFERIHPFMDGNGRIGRILTNFFLKQANMPQITIWNKEKRTYYDAFGQYDDGRSTDSMTRVFYLVLSESLHKRITYLRGEEAVHLNNWAKENERSVHALLNAARRQTIPAFREKGKWRIGKESARSISIGKETKKAADNIK